MAEEILTRLGTDIFSCIESISLTGGVSSNILDASGLVTICVVLNRRSHRDPLLGSQFSLLQTPQSTGANQSDWKFILKSGILPPFQAIKIIGSKQCPENPC